MSAPIEILLACLAVSGGPTLAVLALDCRCKNGRWPDPRRGPWRELARLVGGALRRGARDLASEDAPLLRVAEFVVSLGLLVRAGVWSVAFVIGGDGDCEVSHGLDREPIAGAGVDTRLAIALFEAALLGLASQWMGGLVLAWPPGRETAVSLLLIAQAAPLLADGPLAALAALHRPGKELDTKHTQ